MAAIAANLKGLGEYYDLRARCYESLGTMDLATADYKKAEELGVGKERARSVVADCTKLIDENSKDLDAAMLRMAYRTRAESYMRVGEYRNAIDDFSQCIARSPQRGYFYRMRSECYDKLGMDDLATSDRQRLEGLGFARDLKLT